MPEQTFDAIDAGQGFDWGRTSADYDRYRPGPPDSFYQRLEAFGIGLPGQRLLDLGTGTGLLARRFARQGAAVAAVDLASGQLDMARTAAEREGLSVDFQLAPAEALPFGDATFDCITANQCWLYFDLDQVLPELDRVLDVDGQLLISYFNFLPRLDPVVAASEALVLEYNPAWSGADWDGEQNPVPAWSRDRLRLIGWFEYDEAIPFTRESWRGRMRALRGIAASLAPESVRDFDRAHAELLEELVPETFTVLHRITAQLFRRR